MSNRSYEDLIVWKKSIAFAKSIIEVTKSFPQDECFALSQQMRRAAVSIGSNIAEGCARESAKEFAHFLVIARGSVAEVKTQIYIAEAVSYISSSKHAELLEQATEIERMLHALIKKI